MNNVIFDSSAMLALINKEQGSDIAEKFLGHIIMSSVNVSEVVSKLLDYGITDEECSNVLESLISKVIDFDWDISFISAKLKKQTKDKGLSLGDRSCIATGIVKSLDIYTADKVWEKLNIPGANIKLIR